MRLIVATRNNNKLKEIKQILKDLDLRIISLEALRKKIRIVENGETFLENAAKKALAVSKAYPRDYVLGEDSGLEVDYLNGAPGIRSKRYAGKTGSQKKNNSKLLKALTGVLSSQRRARFYCGLVLAKANKTVKVFKGTLSGRISMEAKGDSGFGYDPVLYLPGYQKTVAQLSLAEKNKISHRGKAFRKLKGYLSKSIPA
tara:strand:- start:247 stop:846 length:600 start_codon:yes stop_codon:yes gene_type:complete